MLLFSMGANVTFLVRNISAGLEQAFAEDIVQTILKMEREGLDSDAGVERYVKYIESYYPSGSKISKVSVLGRIVEMCRKRSLERLREI